ncbi:MAG: cardiolipin synthase, partial [Bacteroidaceae bacterium]
MFDYIQIPQGIWIASKWIYILFITLTSIVVLLDNKGPIKTWAWLMVLIFVPVIGVVLYILLGHYSQKERIISKRQANLIKRQTLTANHCSEENTPLIYRSWTRLFLHTNQSVPFANNGMTIFTTGQTKLNSLLEDIAEAKDHIHMQYYIIANDAVGIQVRDLLIQKAEAGIEVRVIYDDVGCWNVPKSFYEPMYKAGIEVRAFLKVRFPKFTSHINYRNHRKVVIIDGQIGYIGGMNLSQRYIDGGHFGNWRDTHIRIVGSAAQGLQSSFLLDWYFVDRSILTEKKYFPNPIIGGTVLMQMVTSNPIYKWKEIHQGFVRLITFSSEYVFMQTPYFIPSDEIVNAMQTAALSGTIVELMIPEKGDNIITQLSSLFFLENLLEAGVKVYLYQNGFLHAKMLVADDTICTVGSANIDHRSFDHNFEINAMIYDAEVS